MAYLRYIMQIVLRAEKDTRLRGTLIHLAMAYHAASQMQTKPPWFFEKDLQTALEERGEGLPDGVQRAKEVLSAYRLRTEPLDEGRTPLFVEDEFFAKVGEIDPEIHREIADLEAKPRDAQTEAHLAHLRYLATFDDEEVSCRPDLIELERTLLDMEQVWIIDHKSRGKPWGRRKGLETWKDDGEFLLDWQVQVNLHIVRAPSNRGRLGNRPVAGFIIQRLTREPDNDGYYYADRHVLRVPKKAYEAAPRYIRMAVAREAEVRAKVANGIRTAQNFWACQGRYDGCDYRRLCAAANDEQAYKILKTDFKQE